MHGIREEDGGTWPGPTLRSTTRSTEIIRISIEWLRDESGESVWRCIGAAGSPPESRSRTVSFLLLGGGVHYNIIVRYFQDAMRKGISWGSANKGERCGKMTPVYAQYELPRGVGCAIAAVSLLYVFT
jgi:hypothetical protein